MKEALYCLEEVTIMDNRILMHKKLQGEVHENYREKYSIPHIRTLMACLQTPDNDYFRKGQTRVFDRLENNAKHAT